MDTGKVIQDLNCRFAVFLLEFYISLVKNIGGNKNDKKTACFRDNR